MLLLNKSFVTANFAWFYTNLLLLKIWDFENNYFNQH